MKKFDFKLFYCIIGFWFLKWFLTNYDLFPKSRDIFLFLFIFFLGIMSLILVVCLISFLPTYLSKKKPESIVWKTLIFGFFMLTFVFLIEPYLPHNLPSGSDLLKFDSSQWKEATMIPTPSEPLTVRQKMLKDLIKNVLPNKTQDQIVNLLGAPTETDKWKESTADLVYVLGPDRGMLRIDHEWLFISLEKNHFKSADIGTD